MNASKPRRFTCARLLLMATLLAEPTPTWSSPAHHVPELRLSPNTRCCMAALLFRAAVLRWLRDPIADKDSACPHGLVCPCGGAVFHLAAAVGLGPELEKPSLPEPRLFVGALPRTGSESRSRVPAALLTSKSPRWQGEGQMALDFALFVHRSHGEGGVLIVNSHVHENHTKCKEIQALGKAHLPAIHSQNHSEPVRDHERPGLCYASLRKQLSTD